MDLEVPYPHRPPLKEPGNIPPELRAAYLQRISICSA